MTYLTFLLVFLAPPILVLGLLAVRDARRNRAWLGARGGRLPVAALLAHVLLAVTYTTPWDNYLVATGVWWYDPARVLGITLGWVPLEEYFFFILQTLLAGLFLFALARRLPPPGAAGDDVSLRRIGALAAAILWLLSALLLVAGDRSGTYLGLELIWALPPIALQLAFGADILWRRRRVVFLTLATMTLYLALADSLAIGEGVWTIAPSQSLNALIGGILPVEELVFFFLTNALVVFGLTLALAPETWRRWSELKALLRRRRPAGEEATAPWAR
jgi:lycopene cyclase domain-containing protein